MLNLCKKIDYWYARGYNLALSQYISRNDFSLAKYYRGELEFPNDGPYVDVVFKPELSNTGVQQESLSFIQVISHGFGSSYNHDNRLVTFPENMQPEVLSVLSNSCVGGQINGVNVIVCPDKILRLDCCYLGSLINEYHVISESGKSVIELMYDQGVSYYTGGFILTKACPFEMIDGTRQLASNLLSFKPLVSKNRDLIKKGQVDCYNDLEKGELKWYVPEYEEKAYG